MTALRRRKSWNCNLTWTATWYYKVTVFLVALQLRMATIYAGVAQDRHTNGFKVPHLFKIHCKDRTQKQWVAKAVTATCILSWRQILYTVLGHTGQEELVLLCCLKTMSWTIFDFTIIKSMFFQYSISLEKLSGFILKCMLYNISKHKYQGIKDGTPISLLLFIFNLSHKFLQCS